MKKLLMLLFLFLSLGAKAQLKISKQSKEIGQFGPLILSKSQESDTLYFLSFKNEEYKEIVDLSFGVFNVSLLKELSEAIEKLPSDKEIIAQLSNGYHLSWRKNSKDKILLFDDRHKHTLVTIKQLNSLSNTIKTEKIF